MRASVALRRAGWIALAVAVVLCVAGIFQHGLWTPDEPREAEIGREMLESRFSAMPTLGGVPFLEKPPLFAWITAASYSVFGVSAGAARVPSALFAIGAMGIAYLLGKRAAGRLAGLCSAIVLGTMWQFAETSHKAVLDTALTFFVAAGHLAFVHTVPGTRRRAPPDGLFLAPYVAIGVLSGLAFLTKAWIGPALLCAPPILAAAAMRDWEYVRRVLPRAFVAATIGVTAFGLPWVFALAHTDGGGWPAVKACLVTEYVGRTVGGEEFAKQGHQNGPFYYAYTSLYVVAPWILALPAIVKSRALSRSWRGGRTAWCALVFVAGIVLLSPPSGKRDLYLVPLMPAASVVAGVWLSRIGSRSGGAWDAATAKSLRWLAWTVLFIVALACLYLGWPAPVPTAIPREIVFAMQAQMKSFAFVAIAFLCPLAAVLATSRPWNRFAAPARPAAALATTLIALFVALNACVLPRVDPLRDMSAGSRAVAALVPKDEKLVGLADETTLAVLPFYADRVMEDVDDADGALNAIDDGRAKHLLVIDKKRHKVTPALARRLTLVKTVALCYGRDVDVYETRGR